MKLTSVRNLVATTLLAGSATLAAGHLDGTGKAFAGPPPASGCASMLQALKTWTAINRSHVVDFAMASNRNDLLVSYTKGTLTYRSGPYLTGPGTQSFSDRMVSGQPFNILKTDQDKVSINLNTGIVRVTLLDWGNAVYTVTPVRCGYGVLYGFASPAKVSLVALSFREKVAG